MKVLVVAPHMDDEALGCGATICKHTDRGDRVSVIFVAHRVYDHVFDKKMNDLQRAHALKAKKIMKYDNTIFLDMPDEKLDGSIQGIIIELEKHARKIEPGIIYLPFREDNNQDHRAVFDAARVVFRPSAAPYVEMIYMYETPSSTEQSPPLRDTVFQPNYYVDAAKTLDSKLKACACYETEKRPYPHPRSKKALITLAEKRGTEIGFKSAEAFMNIRGKWA